MDIPKSIREELPHLIVPRIGEYPELPHFVLEVKGPNGSSSVVQRQAAHSGAAAARAAFALENLGVEKPIYHDRALVHAWTYCSADGVLQHYAVRVSRPKPSCSNPGYHMTKVAAYFLTNSNEHFRKGVSALWHSGTGGINRTRGARDAWPKQVNACSGSKSRPAAVRPIRLLHRAQFRVFAASSRNPFVTMQLRVVQEMLLGVAVTPKAQLTRDDGHRILPLAPPTRPCPGLHATGGRP